MKVYCLLGVAGLAVATGAGFADIVPAPAGPERWAVRPVNQGEARRADPVRIAGARLLPGGEWERTTAWMPYGAGGGGGVASDEPYYASFELDNGDYCGGVFGYVFEDADGRVMNLPYTVTNMKIADNARSAQATGADLRYWWTDNGAGTYWYIAIFTADSVSTDCSLPAFGEPYDGVVLTFNPLSTGYWYTELRGLEAYGLFFQMPVDAEGAWVLIFDTPEGDPLLGAQEVAYGTSNNGGSPGRPGESTDPTWSDRNANGEFEPDSECLSYALGLCPDPLTTGINFFGPPIGGQECYADCSGDELLDLFDFLCFTNNFNSEGPYSDCNGDGAHDLFDFLCFINAFGESC